MKTLDDAVIELNGVLPGSSSKAYSKGEIYPDEYGTLFESCGIGCGGNFICTSSQFQRRAKELGFVGGLASKPNSTPDNDANWFDYDNQKALRLPPVGVWCQYSIFGDWTKVFIVGCDSSGGLVYQMEDCTVSICGLGCEYFRPLDHDRKDKAKAKAEKDRTRLAIYNKWLEREDIDDVAKWLWSLGFRVPE